MRLHPREQQTNRAETALAIAMYEELAKHDLTGAEWLRVVNAASSTLIGRFARDEIRIERHGDVDTPGGVEG